MINLPVPLQLTDCRTGSAVNAQLVELNARLAKAKVDGAWWRNLGVSSLHRREEGDHSWNWAARIGMFRNLLAVESVGIQTSDGEIQGAMIYRIDGASIIDTGKGAVYIDRLATAPRNREGLVEEPAYRGAGSGLLRWAAYHSYKLGLDGRLVLASLPDPNTTAFYERLGFKTTPADEDDMVVYELEPHEAQAFIAEDVGLK